MCKTEKKGFEYFSQPQSQVLSVSFEREEDEPLPSDEALTQPTKAQRAQRVKQPFYRQFTLDRSLSQTTARERPPPLLSSAFKALCSMAKP